MVPVVEQATVPELVTSTSALVEVEVVCAVEVIEAVKHVLAGM